MAELFERHDPSQFELFAISFSPENNSPIRQRLEQTFDHFIDVRQMSDFEVAQQIRNLEIDIAVDLKGHTKGSRKLSQLPILLVLKVGENRMLRKF